MLGTPASNQYLTRALPQPHSPRDPKFLQISHIFFSLGLLTAKAQWELPRNDPKCHTPCSDGPRPPTGLPEILGTKLSRYKRGDYLGIFVRINSELPLWSACKRTQHTKQPTTNRRGTAFAQRRAASCKLQGAIHHNGRLQSDWTALLSVFRAPTIARQCRALRKLHPLQELRILLKPL